MDQIKTLTVNGKTYEIADPDAAHIDDTAVGENAWSAKNIIDRLCPAFSASGPAVRCTPVAGYPLQVVSAVEEADTVTLQRCGKNIIPYPYAFPTRTSNGVTFTDNGDGSITVNGTATANAYHNLIPIGGIYLGPDYVRTDSAGTAVKNNYAFSLLNGTTGLELVYQANGVLFIQVIKDTAWENVTVWPQVECGTAVTEYEPYRGEKFTADFGQTVYGGTYDWAKGILTDADGNETQLTPQQIPALSGVNTLMGDTGNTTVTGRADLPALLEALTISQ